MNIVIYASDAKHGAYLNGIVLEAWSKANVFYMVSNSTVTSHPTSNSYSIDTNIKEQTTGIYSDTLQQTLPFRPDWLIVSRERWFPESEIILEFKHKFGSKVALVEPNSAMVNSVNQYLESESRNRFKDVIDVYFDHSTFISNQRRLLGFKGNTVVTGNPKYDINLNVSKYILEATKEKYNVDDTKKKVLFFTLQNKYRYRLFENFKKFKEDNPQYQYFVKPYPGEPYSGLFKHEYNPEFLIPGVTPILEELDIWPMYNICQVHVGVCSSVMYPSYFLNKEVVDYTLDLSADKDLDNNQDIINGSSGHEDKLEIWFNTFKINLDQFKQLTNKNKITPMLKNNKVVWNYLKNVLSYKKDILNLYDDFNDQQASKRIVDYLLHN